MAAWEDEDVVGSEVWVWWPGDRVYYEGVVVDTDPAHGLQIEYRYDGEVHWENPPRHYLSWTPPANLSAPPPEPAEENTPEATAATSFGAGAVVVDSSKPPRTPLKSPANQTKKKTRLWRAAASDGPGAHTMRTDGPSPHAPTRGSTGGASSSSASSDTQSAGLTWNEFQKLHKRSGLTSAKLSERFQRERTSAASAVDALSPAQGPALDTQQQGAEVRAAATDAQDGEGELADAVKTILTIGETPTSSPVAQDTREHQCHARSQGDGPTVIIYPHETREHALGPSTRVLHQENPRRLDVLVAPEAPPSTPPSGDVSGTSPSTSSQTVPPAAGILRRQAFEGKLQWVEGRAVVAPASTVDLMRVHDWQYLEHLENTCNGAGTDGLRLDADTLVDNASYTASKIAAGAAIAAVDHLFPPAPAAGGSRFGRHDELGQPSTPSAGTPNTDSSSSLGTPPPAAPPRATPSTAFVAARPPGHHAGPSGAVPGPHFSAEPNACSCGFCLVNTVAVAAAYARGTKRVVRRVAIVDLDIHHGNGTEEIIRAVRPRSVRVPLPSSWAPRFERSYKPFLDAATDPEELFFGSIHLHDGTFYPGSGADSVERCRRGDGHDDDGHPVCPPAPPAGKDHVTMASCRYGNGQFGWDQPTQSKGLYNIVNCGLRRLYRDKEAKDRALPAKRAEWRRAASKEFRHKMSSVMIPELQQFGAELVFVSLGADGHDLDMYHSLTGNDYAWAVKEIMQACPRVVVVLEGGYHVDPPPSAVADRRPVRRKREVYTPDADSKGKSKVSPEPVNIARKKPVPQKQGPISNHDGGLARVVACVVGALSGVPVVDDTGGEVAPCRS